MGVGKTPQQTSHSYNMAGGTYITPSRSRSSSMASVNRIHAGRDNSTDTLSSWPSAAGARPVKLGIVSAQIQPRTCGIWIHLDAFSLASDL